MATTSPTAPGWAAFLATLATLALGFALPSPALLVVAFAAAVFLTACRLLAGRHLAGAGVERTLPPRVRAGESFVMELRIHPGPRFPATASLLLSDPLAPSLRDRELPPRGGGGGPLTLRCTGLVHRRGALPQRPILLRSTWPGGLFLTEHSLPSRDDRVPLVHPKPWLPPRLLERLDELALTSSGRAAEPSDPLDDFRLLREFRAGDPVKGISWAASLRTGRLQVAETDPPRPRPGRRGLILHSYTPPGTIVVPETYETVLRLVAGLLLRFQRDGITTLFCQGGGDPVLLVSPRDFSHQLDLLALSRRRPATSLDQIAGPPSGGSRNPFVDCDELFVVGDGSRAHWEQAMRRRFPRCTCLDPHHLGSPSLVVPGRFVPALSDS